MNIGLIALLRDEMQKENDPAELAKYVTAPGSLFLEKLGFPPNGPAEVAVDIGVEGDTAKIVMTYPLPPEDDA